MNLYGYETAARPDTSPHQCVNCLKGNPGDGPFFRFPNRHPHIGDLWFCADCQEMVLHAWRLVSLPKHEEEIAQVQAAAAAEVEAAREAMARTSELDQLLAEATTQAREATERAELAEQAAARRSGTRLRRRTRR